MASLLAPFARSKAFLTSTSVPLSLPTPDHVPSSLSIVILVERHLVYFLVHLVNLSQKRQQVILKLSFSRPRFSMRAASFQALAGMHFWVPSHVSMIRLSRTCASCRSLQPTVLLPNGTCAPAHSGTFPQTEIKYQTIQMRSQHDTWRNVTCEVFTCPFALLETHSAHSGTCL